MPHIKIFNNDRKKLLTKKKDSHIVNLLLTIHELISDHWSGAIRIIEKETGTRGRLLILQVCNVEGF